MKELDKDKRFNIIKMVADTGGAGRLFVEEIQSREGLTFEAAKKSEKYEHVMLMNDDFLTGKIKCLEGSSYGQCVASLPKDPEWEPESGKPPGEDPRFPNHEADAGLYSHRFARAYLAEERPKAKPKPGSKEAADQQEEEMLEEAEREENKPGREWWEAKGEPPDL
jgi:hypothetical protein